MENVNLELTKRAKAIPRLQRIEFIKKIKETELHKNLRELYQVMEPDCLVEITHGNKEYGKDLVIIKKDNITQDVIAVVVKSGDVSGKTMGDVEDIEKRVKRYDHTYLPDKKIEEIISQIKQSKLYDADLKLLFTKLPISHVHVVIAGAVSNNAKQRINKEINHQGKIIDIDELVEDFTNYYPQVFFQGELINLIIKKIQYLEGRNWIGTKKNNKNLSEYFVPPLVGKVEIPVNLDSKNLDLIFSNARENFQLFFNLINKKKNLIIVGDQGCGKSTAIAKITIEYLKIASQAIFEKGQKESIDIPLVVTAKELMNSNSNDELLNNYFDHSELIKRFKINMLLVDGLDEIKSSERSKLIEKAVQFNSELKSSLVITSRKVDIVSKDIPGFEKYELLPFEYQQAIKLFQKLVDNNTQLDILQDGLEKIKDKIPITPLSLLFLIELVETEKEIPASLTELYDRFIDISLGKDDNNKGIEVLFEYRIKKRFLGSLACNKFLREGKIQITDNEYIDFMETYASEHGIEDLDLFTHDIERSGLICIRDNNYEFKHRTFLDFFAGFYLVNHGEEINNNIQFFTDIYFDELWGDTLFFIIGFKNEISLDLLNSLFKYPINNYYTEIQKFMLGRILQAGWDSTNSIKEFGIKSSVMFSDSIRETILEITDKSKKKIPRIVADILLLNLAEESFKSRFLKASLQKLLNNELISEKPDLNIIYITFYSLGRLLDDKEYEEIAKRILDLFGEYKEFETEAKMRTLIMLSLEASRNKKVKKLMQRKTKRLIVNNEVISRKLLPERKKGFRPGK